jgi:hypothetical protein
VNQYTINWFHLLYEFSEDLYEIPQLEIMLTARQEHNILTIYDIAARKPVSFAQIIPFLDFEGVDTIKFGFNPDWLLGDYQMGPFKNRWFHEMRSGTEVVL